MLDVFIALIPASAFGVYNFGVPALIRLLVGIFACVAFEAIYQKAMKKKVMVGDMSAAVTGLLLAMNIPSTLPIWMEVVGCAFAIIIVKQLFGGLGQNFMNPALAARCFLLLAYTRPMTDFVIDGVSAATPLQMLKPGGEAVGVTDLLSMFIGTNNGVIGETSAMLLLAGGIYLLIRKVIKIHIPLAYIGMFAAMTFFLAPGHQFDIIYTLMEVCGGGILLGAFFMATDYVTSPVTNKGKIYFGLILGVLTFLFRMFGPNAEGVAYSIIIANLLTPFLDMASVPKPFGWNKPEKKEADRK
ncbi:MAG: RnfABCDGE type electron transport complex subunit D [Christensenellales bacterium]|nr:RnfABCDGE type electron transport complex subunit D [Lachnospiraceae bacterium]